MNIGPELSAIDSVLWRLAQRITRDSFWQSKNSREPKGSLVMYTQVLLLSVAHSRAMEPMRGASIEYVSLGDLTSAPTSGYYFILTMGTAAGMEQTSTGKTCSIT